MLQPAKRSRWTLKALALAAAMCCFALFAAQAGAAVSSGTYSVYSCAGPEGEFLGSSAWQPEAVLAGADDFLFSGACGSGPGSLNVALLPAETYAAGAWGAWIFSAPPDTDIVGYSITRTAAVSEYSGAEGEGDFFSAGIREQRGLAVHDEGCVAVSENCTASAEPVTASSYPLDTLRVRVACAGLLPCGGERQTTVTASLQASRVDLSDETKPDITSIGGTILGGPQTPGVRTLTVSATDEGGGIRGSAAWIDELPPQEIVPVAGSCVPPYTEAVPCLPSANRTFNLDTTGLAPGEHQLRTSVTDVAGNTRTFGPILFTVTKAADPPATPPTGGVTANGFPAVNQPSISFDKALYETSAGGMVVTSGKLVGPDGSPISGAKLEASWRDLGLTDAGTTDLPSVTTANDGSFSVPIDSDGAKRLTVSFRPSASAAITATGSTVIRRDLTLSVKRSKARVKRGRSIVVSGLVTGAGAATEGVPVEIDALVKGKWRAVAVVETSKTGRYAWKYRFVRVSRTTRFRFRAVVRRNATWPWPTEIGSSVKVLVRR